MNNSKAYQQNRARNIAQRLAKAYPRSRCALKYATPFQLLVATVLSAQTTDLAVNKVTPELFRRFPDAKAMAAAPAGEIEALISGIGLWRNKAKFLRDLSAMLLAEHGGELPRTIAQLKRLPGVAQKTATAVLGTAFGLAVGITVDTHMLRINRLLGLSKAKSANGMARDLEQLIPKHHWTRYTHRIIDHGRVVCVAKRPRCGVCPLLDLCPSAKDPSIGYKPQNDSKLPASAKGLSWLS